MSRAFPWHYPPFKLSPINALKQVYYQAADAKRESVIGVYFFEPTDATDVIALERSWYFIFTRLWTRIEDHHGENSREKDRGEVREPRLNEPSRNRNRRLSLVRAARAGSKTSFRIPSSSFEALRSAKCLSKRFLRERDDPPGRSLVFFNRPRALIGFSSSWATIIVPRRA